MKRGRLRTISLLPRVLLTVLWAGLCTALVAAPWLEAHGQVRAADLLYALFSPVCHQDPARSFTLLGHQWAVCHRCSGIYLGLLLGSFLPFNLAVVMDPAYRRRLWVGCATAPLLLDVILSLAGLWTSTPGSRFITGLIFGAMLSSLLGPAFEEFIHEARWRRDRHDTRALGGLS